MHTKNKAEKPPMKLSGVEEFNDKFKHLQERAARIAEARSAVAFSASSPEAETHPLVERQLPALASG